MNFWLSWWHRDALGGFELYSPWWRSGYRSGPPDAGGDPTIEASVCAAVRASDAAAAQEVVLAAYDRRPAGLEFRFVEARAEDWSPYGGRFPRAEWMPDWPAVPRSGSDA